MLVNRGEFENAVNKIGGVPFELTSGWIDFKSHGDNFVFFVDDIVNPMMACCGRIHKKPIVGRVLDIVGEAKAENVTSKVVIKFFTSLIADAGVDLIVFNSTSIYDCAFEIAIRRSGFTRPFGFCTCPLTILVNIQDERSPDRMWRRNLKKAVDQNLTFEVVEQPSRDDAVSFIQCFEELRAMKSLGYSLSTEKIYGLVQSDGYKLFFVSLNGRRLCGRILYIDDVVHRSYDVFAANSFESRKYAATHFMMERIFAYLKNRGVCCFDFSRIPPSNNEMDSVYLFKQSAGGYPQQYNGEWIWSKHKYLLLLFCVYNFFIRKAHNY